MKSLTQLINEAEQKFSPILYLNFQNYIKEVHRFFNYNWENPNEKEFIKKWIMIV